MVFILSGYEHCIADFPYLLLNFSMVNVLKYIMIIAGKNREADRQICHTGNYKHAGELPL